jgi:hypothetical protein
VQEQALKLAAAQAKFRGSQGQELRKAMIAADDVGIKGDEAEQRKTCLKYHCPAPSTGILALVHG